MGTRAPAPRVLPGFSRGSRRFLRAWWLLLRALWEDPIGSPQWLRRRAAGRVERWRDDHIGIRGRNFLEVDPTVFCDRPRPQLSKRRAAYIMGVRMPAVTESGELQRCLRQSLQSRTPVPDGLCAAAAVMSGKLGIKGAGRAYPDPGQHACRTNPECYGARSGKAPGGKACRAAGRNRQTVDIGQK